LPNLLIMVTRVSMECLAHRSHAHPIWKASQLLSTPAHLSFELIDEEASQPPEQRIDTIANHKLLTHKPTLVHLSSSVKLKARFLGSLQYDQSIWKLKHHNLILATFHLSTESMNEEIPQPAQNLGDLQPTNFQPIDIESSWLVRYPSIASIRHTVKLEAGILGSVQND
jgi:hypothetical protein